MLESRELYCITSSWRNNKPKSQIYFEKNFDLRELDQKVTTNVYFRSFQYKILKNIIYLNEKPFDFGLSTPPPSPPSCSRCNFFSENITHLFCDCATTQCLSKKLYLKLKDDLTLPPLIPQVDIFGFLEPDCQSYLIQNKFLSSTFLLKEINKIKNREKSCICKPKEKHCI